MIAIAAQADIYGGIFVVALTALMAVLQSIRDGRR